MVFLNMYVDIGAQMPKVLGSHRFYPKKLVEILKIILTNPK